LGNVPNTDCTNASNITTGTLSSAVLPPVALTTVAVYASEAAMLAATTEEGDVGVRSDQGKSYMRNSGSSGTMSDWTELQTPTDTVLSVNTKTGTVTLTQDDIGDGSTYVRTENNLTDALAAAISSALQNVVEDTTPQLGGNLDLNSKGIIITGQTVGGSDGNLVYLSAANTWSQADADAESTCKGMLGIRVSATSVMVQGIYTTTGLTAGAIYYASTTAGGITTTAPSGTGDIVRIIGYALSTTQLFVDPDKTYVEVA